MNTQYFIQKMYDKQLWQTEHPVLSTRKELYDRLSDCSFDAQHVLCAEDGKFRDCSIEIAKDWFDIHALDWVDRNWDCEYQKFPDFIEHYAPAECADYRGEARSDAKLGSLFDQHNTVMA